MRSKQSDISSFNFNPSNLKAFTKDFVNTLFLLELQVLHLEEIKAIQNRTIIIQNHQSIGISQGLKDRLGKMIT